MVAGEITTGAALDYDKAGLHKRVSAYAINSLS